MIKINHDSIQFSTQLCLFYAMSASAGENYPVQGENVLVCMSPHPRVENVPFRVKMPQFSFGMNVSNMNILREFQPVQSGIHGAPALTVWPQTRASPSSEGSDPDHQGVDHLD